MTTNEVSEPAPRATISDVAAAAQVSRAAVSKVLRNAYGVSDDMRQRVDAAIRQLDYRPLVSAQGLRGRTNTIGVTIPDASNHFFVELIQGALNSLKTTPYQLVMAPADSAHRAGDRAIEALYDRQVDGILTISPMVDPRWLETLGLRVPLVELGRHDSSRSYDTVVGDDVAGTEAVMRALLDLGHTSIAHVTQVDEITFEGATTPPAVRRAVYERMMHEAGLGSNIRIISARYQEMPAYEATRLALDNSFNSTAIFAGNDDAALGVLRALAERNVTDVSVCGYDNTPIADHPLISLTSVDQHGHEMGALAMRLLMERIGGRGEVQHELIAPRLVSRRSTLKSGDGGL